MSRWAVWCALLCVWVAGCGHGEVLILDSTPSGTTRVSDVLRGSGASLADHSRSDWANASPIAGRLDPMGKITCVTVHHSAEVNDLSSDADIVAHLRRVRTSQCRSKAEHGLGAGDLAYHFVIDRNGAVWEGRSLRYQGAHAGNSASNRGNVGVCLLGNFNVQYPNRRQKTTLRSLLEGLMKRYGLTDRDIYTHREIRAHFGLSATECPGTHLQSAVDAMRHGLRVGRR